MLSSEEFNFIAARALNLEERIKIFGEGIKSLNPDKAKSKLEEWIRKVYKNDFSLFDKRLAMDNLNRESVMNLLGDFHFNDYVKLPEWKNDLHEMIEFVLSYIKERKTENLEYEGEKIPFIDVMEPFALYGYEKVKYTFKSYNSFLTKSGDSSIKRALLDKVFPLMIQVLKLEFDIYKHNNSPGFGRLFDYTKNYNSDELYKSFNKFFLEENLIEFFKEYSTLAKNLTVILKYESNNLLKFLHRLEKDYDKIKSIFNENQEPGKIVRVESGKSDAHNCGQTVYFVYFESGLRLVYKPKNIDNEKMYNNFLGKLSGYKDIPEFKQVKTLSCENYGWVEFIHHTECISIDEVNRFYQRIGILIGLIYVLNGSDYHAENVIADGEFPVLVDLETIMHPPIFRNVDPDENIVNLVNKYLLDSVIKTGFLPNWSANGENIAIDMSALGSFGEQETPMMRNEWENVNSDKMKITQKNFYYSEKKNVPYLNNKRHSANDYEDEIIAGFTKSYNLFKNDKSILEEIINAKQTLRYVVKPTQKYGMLISHFTKPEAMREGTAVDLYIDYFAKQALTDDEKQSFYWELFKDERKQLYRFDIPYFLMYSDSKTIFDSDGFKYENAVHETAINAVKKKIDSLNQTDLERQVSIIKTTLAFREIEKNTVSSNFKQKVDENIQEINKEYLVKNAGEIVESILKNSIKSKSGLVSWIGIGFRSHNEKPFLKPLSIDLYEGISGIALYLAAYYKITKDDEILKFLKNVLRFTEGDFKKDKLVNENLKYFLIGAASGTGSVIYSLLKIGEFIEDDQTVCKAKQYASLINDESISHDKMLDIIGGSAGAVLALLILYNFTKEDEYLSKAILCGEHLLRNRKNFNGFNVWPAFEDKALTGFSHGAAGFAYSLFKLFEATNYQKYYDAAAEAIEFETTLFNRQHMNWPDLRWENNGTNFSQMVSWCHGAPGIGLSRLAISKIYPDDQINNDIDYSVIKSMNNYGYNGIDHACCGKMGLNEFLFNAGMQLNKKDLMESVYKNISSMLQNYKTSGAFKLFNNKPVKINNYGFFQGLSGIGYQLLRFAEPDKLPSVLLFE